MGRKSDARKQRQTAKAEARRNKDLSLILTVQCEEKSPKIEFLADDVKRIVVSNSIASLEVPKQVREARGGSRFGLQMSWCARKADRIGAWSWGEPRDWDDEEYRSEIESGLNSLQGLAWEEIQSQLSDTSHLMHHDHAISDLCPDAQRRWRDLHYEEFDVLFRFRLGNLKRAWGIVVQSHFFMVWWDRKHSIYPTSD